ncbi:MAG: PA2779 family protein, partial [Pseudomonas sp.]
MKHTSVTRRYLAIIMATLFMLTSMVSIHAQASMVGTHEVIASEQLSVDRDQLKSMLDDEAVQDKLASMGVSPEQVEQRINSLTADELAHFNA